MAWIELHQEFRDHHKNDRLADELGISISEARSIRVCLWLWAAGNARSGEVTKFTSEEIWRACCAYELTKGVTPKNLMKGLVNAQIIDIKSTRRFIHNWKQFGTRLLEESKRRAAKSRREKELLAQQKKDQESSRHVTVQNDSDTVRSTLSPSFSPSLLRGQRAGRKAAHKNGETMCCRKHDPPLEWKPSETGSTLCPQCYASPVRETKP